MVDATLRITTDCPAAATRCAVDLEVTAPDVPGEVAIGVGDLDVRDWGGGLVFDGGVGDLLLDRVGGGLVATMGVGSADGVDLALDLAAIEIGTGSVSLSWDEAPRGVAVETGVGDILIEVPTGAYACDLASGVGDVDMVGVVDDADADRWIRAHAGTGSVRLVAR